VAVLDTEKAAEQNASRLEHSLAEEVTVKESYLAPYVDFLLGKVVKCRSVEELRSCRTGITPDCMLYHNFRLQYINPDNYTKYAYIGKDSVRKRIRLLVQELEKIKEEMALPEQAKRDADRLLALESLSKDTGEYVQWLRDMESRAGKLKEQKKLLARLEVLKAQNVAGLEKEREAVLTLCDGKKRERDSLQELMAERRQECGRTAETISHLEELLLEKEREQEKEELTDKADYEKELSAYLSKKENPRWDKERDSFQAKCAKLAEEHDRAREELFALRGEYLRKYPNRNFSLSARDNASYDRLLTELSCDHLEEYRKKAASQAKAAVLHFKDDFIYKIRSAIKEALQRKDELNRIINRLDFGKDRYQFVIGKSRGAEGRYYDMFMDESLEVNPADLNQSFDNQMNLFTMEHENQYGEEMNELISMFIPPDNATADELEEARRNMEKYSDYRTYLSFDMQQLIRNEDEVIKIRLSKMIKKNSGGEGQNPLYVALLASFAQAYHINQPGRGKRNPTIRLVVLDEAFSKMDAEKVASCIELIRGLGFQAIISATNDKIQNYVENVDKTFVFANPNKKSISIQEFEKRQFSGLVKDLEG
jgi:uncharacterized protein YPO0396